MDKLLEALENISLGKPIGWLMLIVIVLTAIFEFSPKIKVNPLSAIFRWIGRKTNDELMKEVNKLKAEVGELKEHTEKMEENAAEDRAETRRVRILRFGDELLHDQKHSKESFDQALKDISDYNDYCKTHPNFQNEMTVATAEVIKEQYKRCHKEHSFV